MSFIRYEILLPTRYNDGTLIEPEKFDDVLHEISERFRGVSFGSSLFSVEYQMKIGLWLSGLPIPKGLNHSAQGCEERATLGDPK